ncbi:MAG: S8 family serine peptidase [Candidatus Lokiarchaeota archaeon]|nr:S8 family serine peptidase [Candidatus Lokiarchaeota archaeon]
MVVLWCQTMKRKHILLLFILILIYISLLQMNIMNFDAFNDSSNVLKEVKFVDDDHNLKISEMPNESFSLVICKFNQTSNFFQINLTISAHNCITEDCLSINESGNLHRYYLMNLTTATSGDISSLFSNSTITSGMLGWENISYFRIPPIQNDMGPIYYNESQDKKDLKQTGDDPLLSIQWGYYMIQADVAYANNIRGENITIGIIDSGVQTTHSDLDDNYLGGYDFINLDANPDDENGHGTHVTGIICAENNSIGIRGVAPQAKFYSYKVLDVNGSGTNFNLAKAIKRAINDDVDVITMSLGGFPSSIVEAAIEDAYSNNIIQVAAAGNDDSSDQVYPAAYPEVFAIGAVDSNKDITSYSNFGNWIDFVGPGGEPPYQRNLILSTYYESNYVYLAGTSMACPFISGLIALMMNNLSRSSNGTSIASIITSNLIENKLISSSQDLGINGKDIYYGYGLPIWDELITTTLPIPIMLWPIISGLIMISIVIYTKNRNFKKNHLKGFNFSHFLNI